MIPYPQVLPHDSISEVVRIVRAKAWKTERAALAQHGWTVQGYLQWRVFGSGVSTAMAGAPLETMADETACLALLDLSGIDPNDLTAQGVVVDRLLALVRWLVPLILDALR